MEKVKVDGKSTMKLVEFDTIKVAREKVPSQVLDVTMEKKGEIVRRGKLFFDIPSRTDKLRLDLDIGSGWESNLTILFNAKLEKGVDTPQKSPPTLLEVKIASQMPTLSMARKLLEEEPTNAPKVPVVKLELVNIAGVGTHSKYFDLEIGKIKTKLEDAMNNTPEGRELVMTFESRRSELKRAGILH